MDGPSKSLIGQLYHGTQSGGMWVGTKGAETDFSIAASRIDENEPPQPIMGCVAVTAYAAAFLRVRALAIGEGRAV